MSGLQDLCVSGVGAMTSVGLTAPSTCAALRAGIARMSEISTYGVRGETFVKDPLVGGRVPLEWLQGAPVEDEWPGHERYGFAIPPDWWEYIEPDVDRLIALSGHSVIEAWNDAKLADNLANEMGLYLGIGGDHETDVLDVNALAEANQTALGKQFKAIEAYREGRAGGLLALQHACRDLLEGRVQGAMVGGIDSLIRVPALESMERANILRSGDNPTGVIPGEAAAFVFLEAAGAAQGRGAANRARLLAMASALEPTAGTESPNQAQGLTTTLHEVYRQAPQLGSQPLIVCDLNGDRYRAMEWSYAAIRCLARFPGNWGVWHPADCIGDTGAASGLVNLIWTTAAFEKSYATHEHVLIWGASDGPARAALLLESPIRSH